MAAEKSAKDAKLSAPPPVALLAKGSDDFAASTAGLEDGTFGGLAAATGDAVAVGTGGDAGPPKALNKLALFVAGGAAAAGACEGGGGDVAVAGFGV